MTDRFTHRILSHIADQRYRPGTPRELAEALSISAAEFPEFELSLKAMIDAGSLVRGTGDVISLPRPGREITGTFRLNERGFGFIMPDSRIEHGDLFVPPGNTGGAQTGDHVRARVIHEAGRATAGRSPYMGRIIQIVQRAEKRYVGNLIKRGSHFMVEVDGRVLRQGVIIRDPHAKNAKLGDKVVVELIEYPTEDSPAEGVITEVLGEQGEPAVETLATMRAYGLPDKFPPQVTEEAGVAARSFTDHTIPPGREDLTGDLICTIDPPDAKDYDDAISLHRLEGQADGATWELGVHIADVSNFVKLGTAMDTEAKTRGNSCYLPRRVVPMLPEILSNGVCSLQEGVNRLCKSAFIRYDDTGRVLGQRCANTVIRSAKRLTYLEAQALINSDIREARRHAKTEPKYPTKLIHLLQDMDKLSRIIRERRLRQGMIVLGLPEVELVFDDSGRVVDAQPEDNAFTHTLIEMFMVEANEAVARVFNGLNIPMIRRIHPDPDAHDITELRQFARVAGFNIPARPSRRELQALLDGVRGKPAQYAVHLAVLKTLSKAEYSPLLIGHFALASEHYSHFTSPIRRYADLVVHRGLDAYFDAGGAGVSGVPRGQRGEEIARKMRDDPRCPGEDNLHDIGRHLSGTERNAEAAEKDLRTYLVMDLLAEHLGEDYAGTVTGVTGSGIFVQLDRFLVDGFVKVDDLPGQMDDRWKLNRTTGALVAQRSGRTITIGDQFTVRLARVNPVGRQMELVIIASAGRKKSTPGTPETSGAPGATVTPATVGIPTPAGQGQPHGGQRPRHKPRTQPLGARKSHRMAMRLKKQRRMDRKKKRKG